MPNRLDLDDLVYRFWAKVDRRGPIAREGLGRCWMWTGSTRGKGYGQIHQGYAHRVSWLLNRGPIRRGLWVLHKCDVLRCVNPAHLFLGTVKDNVADMMAKGRHADISGMFAGEQNCKAKLTAHQVRQIRDLRRAGTPPEVLAVRYRVSKSTVVQIARRATWKHLS